MKPPLRRRWRPVFIWMHRWIGLTVGLLLVLNAITGSMMLAARPLDAWLHPELFKVAPQPQAVPLEVIRQSLRAEFGPRVNLTLRPPRSIDESLLVHVRGKRLDGSDWAGQVYFDPYSGQRLGARHEQEGFANALFEFHSELLAGETGKLVLAFNTLTMLLMVITGYLLWWPARWRNGFTVSLRGGLLRSLFDLHRVGGALLGLWVLVCVASGTWMAWRPISQWVNLAAGHKPVVAPKPAAEPPGTPAATVDTMVARANETLPGGIVGYVQLPGNPSAAIRLRKKLDDDPHPNGLSSVWLHPQTGEVLQVNRWNELDIGARLFAWIYPLHSGQLAGALGVIGTAAGGVLLLGYGISGTWLWWLRRRRRPQ